MQAQIFALAAVIAAVQAQSGSTVIAGNPSSGTFNGVSNVQTTSNSIAGSAVGTASGSMANVGSGTATGAIDGKGWIDGNTAYAQGSMTGTASASNGASAAGSAAGTASINSNADYKASGSASGSANAPGVGAVSGSATGTLQGNLNTGKVTGAGTANGCVKDAAGKETCGVVNTKATDSTKSAQTSNAAAAGGIFAGAAGLVALIL